MISSYELIHVHTSYWCFITNCSSLRLGLNLFFVYIYICNSSNYPVELVGFLFKNFSWDELDRVGTTF